MPTGSCLGQFLFFKINKNSYGLRTRWSQNHKIERRRLQWSTLTLRSEEQLIRGQQESKFIFREETVAQA